MSSDRRAAYDRVLERRRAVALARPRRRVVALARHFREADGLSRSQIVDRLGRSPATITAYFYDPTGGKGFGEQPFALPDHASSSHGHRATALLHDE
jgi:hypothetical protein